MRTEVERVRTDASDYVTSGALELRWYTYEEFKELDDLRRSTTIVGYLPIHLVLLLAADVAKMMDGLRGRPIE